MSKRVGFRCAVCKTPVKGEQHAANHAKATAHAEFEEYEMAADEVIPVDKKTELTEEQRQQREALIEREKERVANLIKQRKEEKQMAQERESQEKEAMRRQDGQQTQEMRERIEEERRLKQIELAKREREAEKRHKDALLAQIAEDKRKREAQQGGQPLPEPKVEKKEAEPVVVSKKPTDYDTCTLQIKQTNGKALVGKFKPEDTIAQVIEYINSNRTDGRAAYTLSTTYPLLAYNTTQLQQTTLLDAKLVPRGALVMIVKG